MNTVSPSKTGSFFIICWLALLIFGCTEKASKEENRRAFEKYFDESLAKISGSAATMQFEIKLNRELNRLISNALDGTNKKRDDRAISPKREKNTEDFLKDFSTQQKQRCNFLSMVDNTTNPTFASIKNSGEIPRIAYSFVVLFHKDSSPKGEIFDSVGIGPFKDQDECAELENMARSIDLPTTACKAWKP